MQDSEKKVIYLVSFGYSLKLLTLSLFFKPINFLKQIAKSESIIITSYFKTSITNFSRCKTDIGRVFENFSAER